MGFPWEQHKMIRSILLASLGWPQDAQSGTMSWVREENARNGMRASLTLLPDGELVMNSQSNFNDRSQIRFNAHAAAGVGHARVSMPGYEADHMPISQAISLFRAHVDSMQVAPSFGKIAPDAPRI